MRIIEKGFAKLNLSLDVLGRRPDRYHEMLMVMQSVSLADDLCIELSEGKNAIKISTDKAFLPNNEKNLAWAAAAEFYRKSGISGWDTHISIKKNVPVCAGMAGGSSDAAAVLRGLNRHFGNPLSKTQLYAAADAVGSDVAFCLFGGTALAYGRGTELRELPALEGCGFAIVKPGFSVSTPVLFNKLDNVRLRSHPDTEGMLAAIEAGDVNGVAIRSFNVFESALNPRERSLVDEAKGALIAAGALGAAMTGTGSGVFGVFESPEKAEIAASELKKDYDEAWSASPVSIK